MGSFCFTSFSQKFHPSQNSKIPTSKQAFRGKYLFLFPTVFFFKIISLFFFSFLGIIFTLPLYIFYGGQVKMIPKKAHNIHDYQWFRCKTRDTKKKVSRKHPFLHHFRGYFTDFLFQFLLTVIKDIPKAFAHSF